MMGQQTAKKRPHGERLSEKPDQADGDDKPIAILIAGMHRSGTSALTRTLNFVGCDLPRNLVPPGPGNITGLWEPLPVVKLDDDILAAVGSGVVNWEPIDPSVWRSWAVQEFRQRALAVLADEFGDSGLFVLKDPRICRLLRFWVEVVEAFGARPVVVLPIRNPIEVAASLEARNAIDPSFTYLLWLRHVLDAEAASRGLTRAFLRYDELLENAREILERLGRVLGITWPMPPMAAEAGVERFLSSRHRHHVECDARVLDDPRVSRWIRSTFAILDRWTRGEIDAADLAELDRIKAAFDDAAPAFSDLVRTGRRAASANARLIAELAEARAQLDGRNQVKAELYESKLHLDALEQTSAMRETALNEFLDRAGEEIDRLRRALVEKEACVVEMRRSVSWRVTVPLRIGDRIGKRLRFSTVGFPVTLALRASRMMKSAPLTDLRATRAIAASELFDRDWYLATYPDVAELGIDPVRHYIGAGAREGRDPGPDFSTCEYLRGNPDVAAMGINPLGHFITRGRAEGRSNRIG